MTTVAELLEGHVTLEVECVDRLYLNGHVPALATGPGMDFSFAPGLAEKTVLRRPPIGEPGHATEIEPP